MARVTIGLLVILVTAACGTVSGPLTQEQLLEDSIAYRTDLTELERDFFEAVGDGDSNRAMQLASQMQQSAEKFRNDVLSREAPDCLSEAVENARSVIEGNIDFYARRAQGRDFPTRDELPLALNLLDLPHSWIEIIRQAEC
jgi:hypothetical protein